MPNDEHVAILKKGVDAWNKWRDENPQVRVNLREGNLSGADLSRADLSFANLSVAHLNRADLTCTNLSGAMLNTANLSLSNLTFANLSFANLSFANLSGAHLGGARLGLANLTGANLSRADLNGATLLNTDPSGADLIDCRVWGVSAWGLKLEGAKQQNLVITGSDEPAITVDNIEVAQLIYLMLTSEKVRDVIDTITSKAVLILGRFTDARKAVLDALREELRKRNYLPILFDFSAEPAAPTPLGAGRQSAWACGRIGAVLSNARVQGTISGHADLGPDLGGKIRADPRLTKIPLITAMQVHRARHRLGL